MCPSKALRLMLCVCIALVGQWLMWYSRRAWQLLHDIYIVEKTRLVGSGFITRICPEKDPGIDVYFVLDSRYFCTLIESWSYFGFSIDNLPDSTEYGIFLMSLLVCPVPRAPDPSISILIDRNQSSTILESSNSTPYKANNSQCVVSSHKYLNVYHRKSAWRKKKKKTWSAETPIDGANSTLSLAHGFDR